MEILNKLKAREEGLTSIDIGMNDVAVSRIFINERLTGYMKEIDKQARKAKRDGLLKYVWPRNGIIHGRVKDGTPTINFYCVNDVINAISHVVPNNTPLVEGTAESSGGTPRGAEDTLVKAYVNPNERVPKRPSEEIAESSDGTPSPDHIDDSYATRTSSRLKKSKKETSVK